MRLYQWWKGAITPGLPIRDARRCNGQELYLGQTGDRRLSAIVPIDCYDPPLVVNGMLYDADLLRTHKALPEWVFTDAVDPSRNLVVRVLTQWRHERRMHGECRVTHGGPVLVAEGRGAHGKRGGGPVWSDSLFILHPGDRVQILPEGYTRTGLWAVWNDNGELRTTVLV